MSNLKYMPGMWNGGGELTVCLKCKKEFEYYIKELGYWVDGYDKERNTVIEYYEKYHEKQVQRDLNRETEICNHLGCDFIILWE